MPLNRLFLPSCLVAVVALAGCGRESSAPAPATPGAEPPVELASPARGEAFTLAWFGVLPCADCDGIQTRLELVGDADGQRYTLQETYLGAEGGETFEQQGDWQEERREVNGEPALVYRLDPQGAGRWFWLQPDGALEMLDGEDRPAADRPGHRLQRL
jgi:copper homeostasis protein (lipoprotein)